MAKLRLAIAALAITGCVHQDQTVDSRFPEPEVVYGPPGGDMEDGGSPSTMQSDPNADAALTGEVTDVEIEATLDGHGEWEWNEDYGYVWRPNATDVGVDFTPYETCGSWVWTEEQGWVYGCDWNWGWLPFHYGQWGWFDDGWAWVPGYEYSPAWVDWRGGGGYVGWRPSRPQVIDHRHHHFTPSGGVRDHRNGIADGNTSTSQGGVVVNDGHNWAIQRDAHWRFMTVNDFGKRNIRAHLMKQAAEGLRVTSITDRPPIRGNVRAVSAASVMHDRLTTARANDRWRPRVDRAPTYVRPQPVRSRQLDRARPSIDETPTAVETPSIYEPGDPFRDPQPTRSPIGGNTRMPTRDWSSASIQPQAPIQPRPPVNPPLAQPLPPRHVDGSWGQPSASQPRPPVNAPIAQPMPPRHVDRSWGAPSGSVWTPPAQTPTATPSPAWHPPQTNSSSTWHAPAPATSAPSRSWGGGSTSAPSRSWSSGSSNTGGHASGGWSGARRH